METTTVTLIMRTVNESLTLETMSNQEENGTSPEETTTLGNTFPTSTEQNPGKFHSFIVMKHANSFIHASMFGMFIRHICHTPNIFSVEMFSLKSFIIHN